MKWWELLLSGFRLQCLTTIVNWIGYLSFLCPPLPPPPPPSNITCMKYYISIIVALPCPLWKDRMWGSRELLSNLMPASFSIQFNLFYVRPCNRRSSRSIERFITWIAASPGTWFAFLYTCLHWVRGFISDILAGVRSLGISTEKKWGTKTGKWKVFFSKELIKTLWNRFQVGIPVQWKVNAWNSCA